MPGQEDQDSGTVQRRRFLKGTGAGALAVGVAGCTEGEDTPTPTVEPDTPTDEAEYGGTFTYGMRPTDGLNVLTASSAYSSNVLDNIYANGTFTHPVTFEAEPWVFDDWTVENQESDNPDVYFSVDTDLTWTDGTEFTLDDVEFAYEFLLENRPPQLTDSLDTIDTFERASDRDDYDFHIVLSFADAYYEYRALDLPLIAEHVWSDVDEPLNYQPVRDGPGLVGLGWGELTQFNADTSAEITFRTGPDGDWDLTDRRDWVEEDELLRTGGPFLDTLRFEFYTSPDRLDRAILNDEVDGKYGSIQSKNVQSARDSDTVTLVPGSDNGFGYVGYNLRRQPLDDTAFRQAMSFLWDDIYWVRRLQQGFAIEGDFVVAPGYANARPDAGEEIDGDARSQVFQFRGNSGVPDYEGVRAFLEDGTVITGEGGEYLGQEYEGSFTGVSAVQDEALYDYSFGEVQSDVLQDAETDVEIRVNGQTIPELTGSAVSYIMYPPSDAPQLIQMDEQFTRNMRRLGIPVERETQTFSSQLSRIYGDEEFDMYHMGWSTGPNAPLTLEGIFHSRNADDHTTAGDVTGGDDETEGNTTIQAFNSYGYGIGENHGADDLIDEALETLDADERQQVTREAVERIYLDHPIDVFSYDQVLWPANSRFSGYLEGTVSPGSAYFYGQLLNIYEDE